MKKIALLLVLVMVLSLGLAACGGGNGGGATGGDATGGDSSSAEGEFTFIIANLAADSDPLNVSYRYLKEKLEAATNGRISVEIYANKAISNSDEEQAEMVRSNTIQMTTCPSYIMAAMNENLKSFYIYDIPYMFRTADDIYAYGDSEIGEQMRKDLLDLTGNIKAYGPFGIGWVKIMTSKDAINSPADLKGMKIRTTSSQFYIGVANNLGGTATSVAYGEAYTALQQKTVDGIMTATSLLWSDKFYEIQKSLACIDPYQITHYPIISNSWYESLPDDLKKAFDDCMDEYLVYVRELEEQAEIDAKKNLSENGINVCEYDDATKEKFVELCMPLWDSLAELVGGKDVIDSANKWLEEYRASK